MSTPRLQDGHSQPHSPFDSNGLKHARSQAGLETYNLKVKFLNGVSLRNLNLEHPGDPGELDTSKPALLEDVEEIDEASITVNGGPGKNSPGHQLTRNPTSDSGKLGTSHSTRSRAQSASSGAHKRPKHQFRRRSTLNWAEKTQTEKEELILEAVQYRSLDVFFSIHAVDDPDKPLYISEIATRVNNTDFSRFDLHLPGNIALANELWLRVWARIPHGGKWQILKSLGLKFPELHFLAQDLEDLNGELPENSVLLHLRNGIYAVPDPLSDQPEQETTQPQAALRNELPTSRYDDFLHLQNLVECVADNVTTIENLRNNIEDLLRQGRPRRIIQQLAESSVQISRIDTDLQSLRLQLTAQEKTQQSQTLQLAARRQRLSDGIESLKEPNTSQKEALSSIGQQRGERVQNIILQRSKIARELQFMFPLETITDKPFLFTIANLSLPSAAAFESNTFTAQEEHEHASALGLVVLLTLRLETYLGVPLPYLATYMASSSEIYDPLTPASDLGSAAALHPAEAQTTSAGLISDLSNVNPHRRFPLYAKGVQPKRFKMGVYLLNRNVEELMNKMGLKAVDVRHTLANLKYLLVVLSSQS